MGIEFVEAMLPGGGSQLHLRFALVIAITIDYIVKIIWKIFLLIFTHYKSTNSLPSPNFPLSLNFTLPPHRKRRMRKIRENNFNITMLYLFINNVSPLQKSIQSRSLPPPRQQPTQKYICFRLQKLKVPTQVLTVPWARLIWVPMYHFPKTANNFKIPNYHINKDRSQSSPVKK